MDWVDLEQVAKCLSDQGVEDGELTCFEGRAVPLYIELGVTPSTRYAYFDSILTLFPRHRPVLREALAASPQRYLVSDLCHMNLTRPQARAVGPDGELSLPPAFPSSHKDLYPWTEPIVFRAGRYLVHRVDHRVGQFWLDKPLPDPGGQR